MNKNLVRSITKARWLSIALMAALPWLSACANSAQPPKPPLSLPFEVQKAGSKVETELQIVEDKEYRFTLLFLYKENDEEDRARVRKLAGGQGVDKNFKLIEPGIPISLKVKINIIDSTGERTMFEQEVSELSLSGWGSGRFSKRIIYLTLKPGHYRVSIETLKDVPELLGTSVIFQIGFYSKL